MQSKYSGYPQLNNIFSVRDDMQITHSWYENAMYSTVRPTFSCS